MKLRTMKKRAAILRRKTALGLKRGTLRAVLVCVDYEHWTGMLWGRVSGGAYPTSLRYRVEKARP